MLDLATVARRILILEDDTLLAKQLARLFAGRGYEVHCTDTVERFRLVAGDLQFDAVLLDLSLPDGNGVDAWTAVRGRQQDAVAVLMTAYGSEEVEQRAKAHGIRSLLEKPLDLDALLTNLGESTGMLR